MKQNKSVLSSGVSSRYFADIEPIFANPSAMKELAELFCDKTADITKQNKITKLAFIVSKRVTVLAAIISSKTNLGIVIIDIHSPFLRTPCGINAISL